MWNYQNVQRTVKDLYDYKMTRQPPARKNLLPLYNAPFWNDYNENYMIYDEYFARKYKNFRFFGQDVEGDNSVEQVYEDFQLSLTAYFMINEKKYTELYRVETMSETLSPTGDYHMTETKTGSKDIQSEYVSGSRSDSGSETIGQQDSSTVNSTKAYNSADFVEVTKSENSSEPRTNTTSATKGQQVDTEDRGYTESHTVTTTGTAGDPNENMQKYIETWSNFSFYSIIFEDICKEFLLI